MPPSNSDNLNLKPSTLNFKLTLQAWPVIAAATIGLCYLTQTVAKGFGIELPDQANIEIVKRCAGWNWNFALLCFQILMLMPAFEEFYFRYFLYKRSRVDLTGRSILHALIPTVVILLLAACVPLGLFGPKPHDHVLSEFPSSPWGCYWLSVSALAVVEYCVRVFLGRLIAKLSTWSIAVFSAILFSAAHYLAQPFPDSAFLALLFFGLAQCWLYRKTGRLWCAILNHSLFNLTNLVLLFILPEA